MEVACGDCGSSVWWCVAMVVVVCGGVWWCVAMVVVVCGSVWWCVARVEVACGGDGSNV